MLTLTGPSLFDVDGARRSYYGNLFPLNPGGIVPAGPSADDLGFPTADESATPAERDPAAFAWSSR